MPYLAAYAIGLAYVITGDSVAARDPLRFWPALVLYPFVWVWGVGNSLLNKL
jgi:hypothetical protein